MEWFVYYQNINAKEIQKFNIFNHASFRNGVAQLNQNDRSEFEKELNSLLMYCFWSKSEYEVVITSWPPSIKIDELDRLNEQKQKYIKNYDIVPYSVCPRLDTKIKIDIYDQIKINWPIFVDYVWSQKEKE